MRNPRWPPSQTCGGCERTDIRTPEGDSGEMSAGRCSCFGCLLHFSALLPPLCAERIFPHRQQQPWSHDLRGPESSVGRFYGSRQPAGRRRQEGSERKRDPEGGPRQRGVPLSGSVIPGDIDLLRTPLGKPPATLLGAPRVSSLQVEFLRDPPCEGSDRTSEVPRALSYS